MGASQESLELGPNRRLSVGCALGSGSFAPGRSCPEPCAGSREPERADCEWLLRSAHAAPHGAAGCMPPLPKCLEGGGRARPAGALILDERRPGHAVLAPPALPPRPRMCGAQSVPGRAVPYLCCGRAGAPARPGSPRRRRCMRLARIALVPPRPCPADPLIRGSAAQAAARGRGRGRPVAPAARRGGGICPASGAAPRPLAPCLQARAYTAAPVGAPRPRPGALPKG